ncbi:MAG: GNAT family N-acetyltransferase [Dysgonamonadaceae bacterium]|jgi:ribosomal protein S18 acetylase RimI-like enzyme|nr:GNAT family N-acetyltransferase [Dysgonamonadaceae bacterium]
MEIKSLSSTNFETIFKGFSRAFADYEMQLNSEQLQAMLKRRGFNPDLSFAAFEGSEIVSFTFNGIGNFNGIPTAYDTGTGTLKTHRGKGLATKIFEHAIPFLREATVKQYLLEVLQHNEKAVSVYRNLGFEVSREFNYFIVENEKIKNLDNKYAVEQIDMRQLVSVSGFWDFYPSWQNSFESIQRVSENFIVLGVFIEKQLVGYSVFEPSSGDVTQMAVDKSHRRKGIATSLFHEISKRNKNSTTRFINTDISCQTITDFLQSKNIDVTGKQFEMIRKI